MLYLFYSLVDDNSASMMSRIYPIFWYLLHTQFMAGVTTWTLNLLPGDDFGFVGHSHIQSMLVIKIYH